MAQKLKAGLSVLSILSERGIGSTTVTALLSRRETRKNVSGKGFCVNTKNGCGPLQFPGRSMCEKDTCHLTFGQTSTFAGKLEAEKAHTRTPTMMSVKTVGVRYEYSS